VRIARQVSHRNVCRVFDLGEVEGSPYISMEYVDGEDLGLLLRRIGRLPGDKAIEFARRLCAGLAAAHEKGVLHRDLKPANIMIDGRGQVLIMDFGLAAVSDGVAGGDIRSGTPAYMAPEQKEGREVTVRSDIYSLGLVLAEMFTGQKGSTESRLSTTVKDLDPAVEKVIQRCLDPNPAKRPQSALDVARALPGGDPLAEALAAGDTPSPEMVAASEDTGALSVRGAMACLAVVVVGTAGMIFWGSRTTVLNATPVPYSLEVLELKAHEMVAGLGYAAPPKDLFRQFVYDNDYANWGQKLKPAEYRAQLAQGEAPALIFAYVQSPEYLNPESPGAVSLNDPARQPGDMDVWLNSQGRLRWLRAIPKEEATVTSAAEFDWNKLFEAAGLEGSRWTAADPQKIPPMAFDARAAWTGTYASLPETPLRIEAAAWKGRPVYFEVFGPWRREGAAAGASSSGPSFGPTILVMILVVALLFALRNLRTGRGNLTGAVRLGVFILITSSVSGFLLVHHIPAAGEAGTLLLRFATTLLVAAIGWMFYMAVEPYVRRHWPQVLIGWTRVLAGNFRDPMVAGHILVGIAAGVVWALLLAAGSAVGGDLANTVLVSMEIRGVIANWFGDVSIPPLIALGLFFLFLLLRVVLRRTWLAALAMIALLAFVGGQGPVTAVAVLFAVLSACLTLAVSMRFGMLALTVTIIVNSSFVRYPMTSNFSAWYAPLGLLEVALLLAVSVWSFRNALGGRKVWKGEFLDR